MFDKKVKSLPISKATGWFAPITPLFSSLTTLIEVPSALINVSPSIAPRLVGSVCFSVVFSTPSVLSISLSASGIVTFALFSGFTALSIIIAESSLVKYLFG